MQTSFPTAYVPVDRKFAAVIAPAPTIRSGPQKREQVLEILPEIVSVAPAETHAPPRYLCVPAEMPHLFKE